MPSKTTLLFVLLLTLGACASGRRAQTTLENTVPSRDRAAAMRVALQAQSSARSGEHDDAIRLYNEALVHDDRLAFAWNNLGLSLMELNAYDRAVYAFTRAADLDPADPRPMSNAGIAYHQRGFDREALRHFEYALERDPNWLEALRGAGRAGQRLRLADNRALERTRHAILVEPDRQWRDFFERERIRIEEALRARDE